MGRYNGYKVFRTGFPAEVVDRDVRRLAEEIASHGHLIAEMDGELIDEGANELYFYNREYYMIQTDAEHNLTVMHLSERDASLVCCSNPDDWVDEEAGQRLSDLYEGSRAR
jgi:hypothetical protein